MSPYRTNILNTFKNGFVGIWHAFKSEKNIRIQFFIGAFVFILGLYTGLSFIEWSLIALAGSFVLGLELTNTAIEISWNHLEPEHHPVVKAVKDVMAGAVLIAAIGASIVGILVFANNFYSHLA